MSSRIDATLEAMRAAMANRTSASDEITRAYSMATGLYGVDLEPVAKLMLPDVNVLTPLRNKIARVKGNGSNATQWKAITGINTTGTHPGVSEGNRGGTIATTVVPYTQGYVVLGLEDYVTWDAAESAEPFDDAKARSIQGLMRSVFIGEEDQILIGNGLHSLGVTPTPTVVGSGAGGAIGAGTYNVACVALTADGMRRSSIAVGVVQSITRTNADASSDTIKGFCGQPSATASTGALSGGASSAAASVAAVRGAFGYAWFLGAPGAEKLAAITRLNSVVLTALPAGGNQALSALVAEDGSKEETFNLGGLYYQALKTGSGAYYKALATGTAGVGTKLTADGKGGVIEINDAIAAIWDAWKFEPDEIIVHRQDADDISKLILSGTTGLSFRVDLSDEKGRGNIAAGGRVTKYISPVTGKQIPITIHPSAMQGTILFATWETPFKLAGVQNLVQIKCLREYYQLDWPFRTRKNEYGVYVREVMQHYAPFTMGIVTGIAPQ